VALDYRLRVSFTPLHEFISSLHTYLCRKSYKKIDLSMEWVETTQERLSPELRRMLDNTEVNGDWRFIYLLALVCPDSTSPEELVTWIEGHSVGELYELLSQYGNEFPAQMEVFRTHAVQLLTAWNEEYFRQLDPEILRLLHAEAARRTEMLTQLSPEDFVDDTTNGMLFTPIPGLEELILVPQYHFQPLNVIWHFGKVTLCHYAARVYIDKPGELSPHHYRILRTIGEKSRMKILRYLHQGPQPFTEIVRHLKISKGITHDHIGKLRSAGFIHAHIEGEVTTHYSLRLKAVRQIDEILYRYITTVSQ